MQTIMLLDELRREIRGILGEKCFLRISKEMDALLVSDAPRRGMTPNARNQLIRQGFELSEQNRILSIDLGRERWVSLIRGLPPCEDFDFNEGNCALYSIYRRLKDVPALPENQPVLPIRMGLKWLGAGDEASFARYMPGILADALRQKQERPAALARLISMYMKNR